ncbi:hypothetical protein FDECE_17575 [Fusarium decemcellulare]|nr:hypothetical protein FDECE_17575 [Fusarium decemcellulare]
MTASRGHGELANGATSAARVPRELELELDPEMDLDTGKLPRAPPKRICCRGLATSLQRRACTLSHREPVDGGRGEPSRDGTNARPAASSDASALEATRTGKDPEGGWLVLQANPQFSRF